MKNMNLFISRFLRVGVLLSAFCIAIGWIFQTQKLDWVALQSYRPVPLRITLSELWLQKSFAPLICYLGLFILILLPTLRVFLSGLLFLKQKEYVMSWISLVVLFGLCLSFFIGFQA